MMKYILAAFALLAIIFGAINQRMSEVNTAALEQCGRAVELSLVLCGSICFWNGLMAVAQEAGITAMLSKLLSPFLGRLFGGLKKGSKALEAISLNVTANLMGLGNAATPLGISAMQELQKEQPKELRGTASNSMVLLTVINTASMQIIPTTVLMLRVKYNSNNPTEIIPCVIACSVLAFTAAVITAKVLSWKKEKKRSLICS